jgi:hypothetical protein
MSFGFLSDWIKLFILLVWVVGFQILNLIRLILHLLKVKLWRWRVSDIGQKRLVRFFRQLGTIELRPNHSPCSAIALNRNVVNLW